MSLVGSVIAGAALLLSSAPAEVPGRDPARLQVLLLTGYNSTKMHNWRSNSVAIRRILEAAGKFEVRINEEPVGSTIDTFNGYDLLVIDYSNYTPALGPDWPSQTRRAYLEFVKGGKGVVVLHATVGSFQNWREFRESLGILEHKKISHGPYHNFSVSLAAPHPITEPLAPEAKLWGEIYNGLELSPRIQVLATAYDDPRNCTPNGRACGSGKREPIVWIVNSDRGRVFVNLVGHDGASFSNLWFQESLVRGAEWAAWGYLKDEKKN